MKYFHDYVYPLIFITMGNRHREIVATSCKHPNTIKVITQFPVISTNQPVQKGGNSSYKLMCQNNTSRQCCKNKWTRDYTNFCYAYCKNRRFTENNYFERVKCKNSCTYHTKEQMVQIMVQLPCDKIPRLSPDHSYQ